MSSTSDHYPDDADDSTASSSIPPKPKRNGFFASVTWQHCLCVCVCVCVYVCVQAHKLMVSVCPHCPCARLSQTPIRAHSSKLPHLSSFNI